MYVGPVRFAVSAPGRGDSSGRFAAGRSGILALRPRPAVAAANIRATRSPSLIFFLLPAAALGGVTPNSRSSRSFRFSSRVRTGAFVPALVLDDTDLDRGADGIFGFPDEDADLLGYTKPSAPRYCSLSCQIHLGHHRRLSRRTFPLLSFPCQCGFTCLFRIFLFFATGGRTKGFGSLFFCLFSLRRRGSDQHGFVDGKEEWKALRDGIWVRLGDSGV